MERTAIESPKSCFGLELNPKTEECKFCDFSEDCALYMGRRKNRTTLSNVKFNLLPVELLKFKFNADDELRCLYEDCYRAVYGQQNKPDWILRHPDAHVKLEAAARATRCTIKLFILSVMQAHHDAKPGATFYSGMLMGDAAIRRVKQYREIITQQFGNFDEWSLNQFMSTESKDSESILLSSEVLVGNWIIGYKLKQGGPIFDKIFTDLEDKLHPLWLALEPAYFNTIFEPWLKTRHGTVVQNKKRVLVSKILGELKSGSKRAIAAFKSRESIMRVAVQTVLNQHGFNMEDFELENPVKEVLPFWNRLGLAIQHLYCLKYYEGDLTALTKLENKNLK